MMVITVQCNNNSIQQNIHSIC